MSSTPEELDIIKSANTKLETSDVERELSFFAPITIDKQEPKRIIISGIALAEGKWRDVYYPYEEIKKSVNRLNKKKIIVDHRLDIIWKDTVVGGVFQVEASDLLRAALYKGEITHPDMIKELSEGRWRANSVRVLFDPVTDPKYDLRAVNLTYDDVSLTNTPACKSCIIIQKELKEKLHELSLRGGNQPLDNSTTGSITTTDDSSIRVWTDVPEEDKDTEELVKWTRAYINNLPNGSFAVIEGDYKTGKCDNKNARHLPYKDANGKVDKPHLRNALARVNQIKVVCGPESAATLQATARKKLTAAAKRAGVGEYSEESELRELAEKSLIKQISDIAKGEGTSDEKLQTIASAIGEHQLNFMDTPSMFKAVMEKIDTLETQIEEIKGRGEEGNPSPEGAGGCPDKGEGLSEDKGKEEGGSKPTKEDDPKVTEEPKDDKTAPPEEPKKSEEPKVPETPPEPSKEPEKPEPPKTPEKPTASEDVIDPEKLTAAALMIKAYRPKVEPEKRRILWKEEE